MRDSGEWFAEDDLQPCEGNAGVLWLVVLEPCTVQAHNE